MAEFLEVKSAEILGNAAGSAKLMRQRVQGDQPGNTGRTLRPVIAGLMAACKMSKLRSTVSAAMFYVSIEGEEEDRPSTDFLTALHRWCESKVPVNIVAMGSEMSEWDMQATVISVNERMGSYQVQRPHDREPRTLRFKFTYRITDPTGRIFSNPQADNYRLSILERRRDRQVEAARMTVDRHAISMHGGYSYRILGEVDGLMQGLPATYYLVTGKNANAGRALLHAKSPTDLKRALSTLDWDLGFWEAFPILLDTHFFWVGWHRLRDQARHKATELRNGQPVLTPASTEEERREREALYEASGLNRNQYGYDTASIEWFEQESIDLTAAFEWAATIPENALRDFLINARADAEYIFSKLCNSDQLQLQIKHGLVKWRKEAPLLEHLTSLPLSKIREFVASTGSAYKARSKAPLAEFLMREMTPAMAGKIRSQSRVPDLQQIAPRDYSWHGLQYLRQDYKKMYASLSQWLFNSHAPEAATKVFQGL